MSLEVKKELEWVSEARAGLYEGHVVKTELVLGPVVLQPPDVVYNLKDYNRLLANVKQEQTTDKTAVTPMGCVKREPKRDAEEWRNIPQGPKLEEEEMPATHVKSECASHVDEAVKRELLKCEADCKLTGGIYQGCIKTQHPSSSHLTVPNSTQDDKLATEKLLLRTVKVLAKPRLSSQVLAEPRLSSQVLAEPRLSSRIRIQFETDTEDLRTPILKSKKPKIHGCDYCGKRFSLKQVLINHIRIHTGEKPFTCKICSKRFSDCAVLARHRRMHAGKKPHACDICGKMFSEKYLLKNHKLVHTGEMQYFCQLCPKTFVNSSNFRRHQRVHNHKYICDICKKHFPKKVTLVSHIINHVRAKYACKVCGKAFVLKGHLNRHLAVHMGPKKVHTCGVCSTVFSQKASLTRHVNRKVCEKKR